MHTHSNVRMRANVHFRRDPPFRTIGLTGLAGRLNQLKPPVSIFNKNQKFSPLDTASLHFSHQPHTINS